MKQFNSFVESLWRLYTDNRIAESKIIELYESKKITEEEKKYILSK